MLLAKLAMAFNKIGILTIGGGMVMLPLIQSEMERYGWLDKMQFMDILGISEATPGPMALNCATFVGWRVSGIPGAVIATLSLAFPAFLSVMILGGIWQRYRKHPAMMFVMKILRVVIAAMIMSFAVNLCGDALRPYLVADSGLTGVWRPLVVAGGVCALVVHGRVSPILALMGGAVAGAGLAML